MRYMGEASVGVQWGKAIHNSVSQAQVFYPLRSGSAVKSFPLFI